MSLIVKNKTAWFSLSVPELTIEMWVQAGGLIVTNVLDAEFVFSKNNKTQDVRRLFESKEFLKSHLTIISSNIIPDILRKKSCLDIRDYIILPHKGFQGMELVLPHSKRGIGKIMNDHDYTSDEADECTRTFDSLSDHCSASGKDCLSPQLSKPVTKTKNSKSGKHKDGTTQMIFYHSFTFDIPHLDDIRVPPVCLMDFKPGVNGCRVMKKRTKLCWNHSG